MYPSDYGYATSGGSTIDRATCLAKELYNWDGSGVSDCKNNDYLLKLAYSQWTLAPYSSNSSDVFAVVSLGCVYGNLVSTSIGVRPTAYLKSNILLSGVGDGSSTTPYNLKLN